jgi:hypothetical protein
LVDGIVTATVRRPQMKSHALTLLLPAALVFSAGAQDLLDSADPARQASRARTGPDLLMTDPAVSKAVRETLAESRPAPLRNDDGRVLRGEAHDKFTRQVDEAAVPSCWRPDAMKHTPPRIGPINLAGLLALPFWGWAIASGKCNK